MAKIACPKCGSESLFSIKQEVFEGPFRCAGCRATYKIRLENDVLKSCEPLTLQDVEKQDIRKHY
ncbi:MAG: transposase [Chloroflexi bacterium]|nr:transposase [Chloroflexota bacterium]